MLELYLKSLKRGGELLFLDKIPYSLPTLSAVLDRNEDEVKFAIELFEQYGLIERLDSGAIFITDIQNFIGKSSTEGDRKREFRARVDSKKNEIGHLSDNRPPELELELELEKELELKLDVSRTRTDTQNFSPQTLFYVETWKSFFTTEPILTDSFDREAKNRLKGLTRKIISETIKKYHDGLNGGSWITMRVDAFDFLTKDKCGFSWFLNATPEMIYRTTATKKQKRTFGLDSVKDL
jgi:predicted phage replisome organizer